MFSAALLIFTFAAISDALDGLLARYFNQYTVLGSILDPIADKLLLVAAFVMLSVKDFVPSWLTVIVISRDLLILLAVLILFLSKENVEMRPAFISKITTCLQLATVFNVLFADYFPAFHQFSICLFWATGLMSVTSFLHYLRQWFRIMGDDQPNEGG